MAFEFKGAIKAYMGNLSPARAGALGLALAATMTCSTGPKLIHMAAFGATDAIQAATTGFKLGAARARAPATCFGTQLDDLADGDNVARSAVFLFGSYGPDEQKFSGSGFIVKDSALHPGGHNHIITASHVDLPNNFQEGKAIAAGSKRVELMVFASDGTYLGDARSVYAGYVPNENKKGHVSDQNDIAVLEMINGGPESWERYDQIRGVSLSKTQSLTELTGVFHNRIGLDHGASGGMVLDVDTGNVIGLAAQGYEDEDIKHISLPDDIGRIKTAVNNKYDQTSDDNVIISERSRGFITTLARPGPLKALGRAGEGIKFSRNTGEHHIKVVGYPQGACVAYDTQAEPFDKNSVIQKTIYSGFLDIFASDPITVSKDIVADLISGKADQDINTGSTSDVSQSRPALRKTATHSPKG